MAVSKRTRYEVLKRDNHSCRYCGGSAPDVKLTVDHVVPVALGGTDNPDNLVAACADCNAGKSSTSPTDEAVADVAQDALRWRDALVRASDIERAKLRAINAYCCEFYDQWQDLSGGRLPSDFASSVASLYAAALPAESMLDAVFVALSARYVDDRFRYFMGVCWKRVTRIQETARQLIDAEDVADGKD